MSVSSPIVLSISFVAAFVGSMPFLVAHNNSSVAKGPDCPIVQTVSTNPSGSVKTMGDADPMETTQLLGSIETLRMAMIQADPNLFKAHSSPDLSFGHSNGHVQTIDEFATTISSGEEIFKRVDLTDRNVKITGNTAVARHHFSADIIYKGELKVFELEIVQIWKKTDRWRLAVRQAYKT